MILWSIAACTDVTGDPSDKDGLPDVVTSQVYEARTDRDGFLTVPVEVTALTGVFQVVVKPTRGHVSTEYLYGPGGGLILDWEDWYDSSFSLTESFFPTEFATTLNWPVRAQDGALEPGTYEVVVSTLDARGNYVGGQDVEVEILTRPEPRLEAGDLRVVVAYAEGVREEPGVVEAVEASVAYWEDLYAAVGITMATEYSDIEVSGQLPDTYEGLDAVAAYHARADQRTILMVVGDRIADDRWLYGEAGGIPGPYTGAEHAAVFVGWLANAGADAEFQDEDVLLFGETMAHEVGHYLGLFHPVEDGWEYWDALDDTEDCRAMGACESGLGPNLMFPYPVCAGGSTATCVRQDQLTAGQAGVLNRYVGVE